MKIHFRKSIRLPLGFRLNFSGSGTGISWGIPGFRIGQDSKHRLYRYLSLPGTGLYSKTFVKRKP